MIAFLLKGLVRDRTRSLFPILIVCAGSCLTVFLYSWMQGIMGDMVTVNARFDTGHVKISTKAYAAIADEMPNDLAYLGVEKLLVKLRSEDKNMIWTARIRFGGILDVPDEKGETRNQGPAIGMAIDLLSPSSPEKGILNLERVIVQGRMPSRKNEILISEGFARSLGVKPGDRVTLIGSTMYGAMALYNFTLAGTVRFGIAALDREAMIADISAIQEALDMKDGAGEILGYSKDMVYSDEAMKRLASRFNQELSRSDDKFSPCMITLSDQNGLSDILTRSKTVGAIIVLVFVFVMSVVLWNSGLMNNIRRYGEIGLRLALGEPRGTLYARMIFESFTVGLVGSILGTTLGLAFSYYLQNKGIDISSMFQKSSMLISGEMRAQITAVSFYIGFLPGLAAPVAGAMAAGLGIYQRQTAQLFKELET
ncbi:MAG: ABC transporter permease [Vulcanimicrobiota bacterium]